MPHDHTPQAVNAIVNKDLFDNSCDWDFLREKVKKDGMRNGYLMAIAPTSSISILVGTTQAIEPVYKRKWFEENLSGLIPVVAPKLSPDTWSFYTPAFEIDQLQVIKAAAIRQKWIDQGQSLNLYMKEPNGAKLDNLYKLAWVRGLKTTYYLRTLGATGAEKTSSDDSSSVSKPALKVASNLVSVGSEAPKACSILDPDCEACQ